MKKTTTENKIIPAKWIVVISTSKNPFVVKRENSGCRYSFYEEGVLFNYAWHFSTRKKARDFAWQMNAAAHYALD